MKIQILMVGVSRETVYIKDRLDILSGNLLNDPRFEMANPEALR
jgi:hypothetical protein